MAARQSAEDVPRGDVRRTLNSLVRKSMVRPSANTPAVYTAVDLDAALESAVKMQESELRDMEARKRELQELTKQQQFCPSGEVSTLTTLKRSRNSSPPR